MLATAGAVTLGQSQAPPAKKSQEAPAVRVTTRLVQVSVVVKDRKGAPLDGLGRDDFALFEDGKPQPIQIFAVERLELTATGAPPPPDTFSNYLDARGKRPNSVTVILLDGLNTRFMDMAYSRQQIIKFLRQLQPGDRIALYTLGNRLRILHDFTADAAILLKALDRHRPGVSHQLEASEPEVVDSGIPGNEELDAFLNDANQRISDFYTVNRVRTTLQALEIISNHLAGFPGRKNLVWVSGGFPLQIGFDQIPDPNRPMVERRGFSDEVDRAVRALNAANIAIYPVDARGLVAPFSDPRGSISVGGPGRSPLGSPLGSFWAKIETMNELADRTGGRAFYNTNDIKGSIRRAIDDSTLTYVLGYYPTHGQWDGKYHKIKVQVRRPGANLRFRQGYFALPEPTFTEDAGERMMRAAAWNPLDSTGVRLLVRAKQFYAAGASRIKLDMKFVPQDVQLQFKDEHFRGALEYLFVQRKSNGTVYSTRVFRQELNLPRRVYEQMLATGMTLSRDFDLLEDVDLVMVVARDPESGRVGSVRIPLAKLGAQESN